MGIPQLPEPCRLFVAVTYRPDAGIAEVLARLTDLFGPVAFSHGAVPFDFTRYYESEMGAGLLKTYCVHELGFDRAELPRVKVMTNGIEDECARHGRRAVDIDPGYLTRDKLVLASTKDFYHRLYLDQGIYAEVTLHYRQGRYRHFSWTYADYRQAELHDMLSRARTQLVSDLKSGAK